MLILPLAVALSQIQPGTLVPIAQPLAPQQGDSDLVAPVAPLSLDAPTVEGDAPLEDNGDIPVPLSFVSRSEALAPVVVQAAAGEDQMICVMAPAPTLISSAVWLPLHRFR